MGSKPRYARPTKLGSAKACARCGIEFQPTVIRRMTCPPCYVLNSGVDPLAFRVALSSGFRQPERRLAWDR